MRLFVCTYAPVCVYVPFPPETSTCLNEALVHACIYLYAFMPICVRLILCTYVLVGWRAHICFGFIPMCVCRSLFFVHMCAPDGMPFMSTCLCFEWHGCTQACKLILVFETSSNFAYRLISVPVNIACICACIYAQILVHTRTP